MTMQGKATKIEPRIAAKLSKQKYQLVGEHGGVQTLRCGGGTRTGRAHAGLDHAGALGDAAEPDGFAAQFEFHCDLFRPGVAGHDRLRSELGGGTGGF